MDHLENIPQNSIPEIPEEQTPVFSAPVEEVPVQESPVIPVERPAVSFPAPEKKAGKKFWKALAVCLLAAILIVVSCGATAYFSMLYWTKQSSDLRLQLADLNRQFVELEKFVDSNSYTGNGNSISGTPPAISGLTPAQIHAQNKNSVVAISNQGTTANIFGQVTETASSGSGFIVSSDGYIVTNYHVIEGAQKLTVIMLDETEYPATVVGGDINNDIALLKINGKDLPYVTLGSSSDLIVGDQVAAIGNPLGELTNSLTTGVISVKDRDVTTDDAIINMLQTDAAINPGNSGGPLFNMKGEVIGITTAKYAGNSLDNIGFAIPIDDVKEMITQLIEKGYITAPYIGISINNKRDGVGVLVVSVDDQSPAMIAGIQAGDLIVGLGEYETPTLTSLDRALRNFEPGDTTSVFVYRNRQVLELTITLGEKENTLS